MDINLEGNREGIEVARRLARYAPYELHRSLRVVQQVSPNGWSYEFGYRACSGLLRY